VTRVVNEDEALGMELSPETIATEQRKDLALKSLIEALLSTGQRPSWTDIQSPRKPKRFGHRSTR